MFDISFGELMLIGVIALVVIGPQRLPTVARTLGHLIGRAQRYVSDVKHDIQKEIDLEELNKVKSQMESAARSVQSSVQDVGSSLSQPIEEARQALDEASTAVQGRLNLDPGKVDAPDTDATADASVQTDHVSSDAAHINRPDNDQTPDATQDANTKPTQEPST